MRETTFRKRFLVVGAAPLLAGLLGAACEGPASLEEAASSKGDAVELQQGEIQNGTTVTSDTWGSASFGCSATMIRDRWMLTARHCTPGDGSAVKLANGATATVLRSVQFPTPNSFVDVTLSFLSAPLTPSGAVTVRGPFPLFKGSNEQLLNKTVYCQGWGAPDAFTVLRSANMTINQVNSNPAGGNCQGTCFRMPANSSNQLLIGGDSGAGCLLTSSDANRNRQVGVMSGVIGDDFAVAAPWFRDWANGVIGNAPTLGREAGYERADLTSAVAYVNPQSKLVEISLAPGATNWSRKDMTTDLQDVLAASKPAAFVGFEGITTIAYRSNDNRIRVFERQTNGSLTKKDLTTNANAPLAQGNPAAFTRADRVSVVVYRSLDNRIIELSRVPNATNWGMSVLTNVTLGDLAPASDPVGYVRADGVTAIVYRSTDNHVRELSLAIGGSWQPDDLTVRATGSPLALGTPFPYTRSDGVSAVLFRGNDNHLRELARVSGSWFHGDLTVAANAPTSATEPRGYVRSDGISAVVFIGFDNRIRELSLSPATGWANSDLIGVSSGAPPLAAGSSEINLYVRADRANAVLYKANDGRIHELRLPKGSGWTHTDLTLSAGGTL